MVGLGLSQLEVASLIGVSDRTLRTRYRTELNNGVAEANLRVAKSLFRMATDGQVPSAAIFWMKARANWREQQDLNIGGQSEKPLVIDVNWAPAMLPGDPAKQNGHADAGTKIIAAEEAEVVWQNDKG